MKRIHILPPLLANQIAAGEVIERPASAIKELLENSLDAGASQITIDIEKAGMQKIRVQDNGCGIYKDDLTKAVARHGTSKIQTQIDLNAIQTLGFRGEALASLAAISELIITSCAGADAAAWTLKTKGVDCCLETTPAAHPQGTTILIRDLFAAIPARKKFLKTEKTEFFHIDATIKRMALCHFGVRFEFYHNQKKIFLLREAYDDLGKEKRLIQLLNKDFMSHAIKIEKSANDMTFDGWIADAGYERKTNDLQYVFINGRAVRDKIIQHAIKQAYASLLPANAHPAFVVYLTMDPQMVDVNVHPTKHEVRFHEPRLIHDFILQAMKQGLTQEASSLNTTLFQYHSSPESKPSMVMQTQAFYSAEEPKETSKFLTNHRYIDALNQRYLLCENPQGLIIIDARTIQAFIAKEKYLHEYHAKSIKMTSLLIPERFTLTPKQSADLSNLEKLLRFGFDMSFISEQDLVVRKIPQCYAFLEIKKFMEEVMNNTEVFKLEDNLQCNYLMECAARAVSFEALQAQNIFKLIDQYPELLKNNTCVKQITFPEIKKFFCD